MWMILTKMQETMYALLISNMFLVKKEIFI